MPALDLLQREVSSIVDVKHNVGCNSLHIVFNVIPINDFLMDADKSLLPLLFSDLHCKFTILKFLLM